jgi:hypothetical protein
LITTTNVISVILLSVFSDSSFLGGAYALAFSQTRYYRSPRDLPPLTPELREVIVGCLLGDLNIQKRYTNAVLRFVQGGCNSEYVAHLYFLVF